MARTGREANEAPPLSAGREPAGPSAGGLLDVVVEEERLPDGRYVLYYAWPRPGTADGPPSATGAAEAPGDAGAPGAPDVAGAPGPVDDR